MHINNNEYQKNSNISAVFETVWRNKEISRVELSRKLEFYKSTVTNIINILLSNGVLKEGQPGVSTIKGGRKPVALSVNNDFGVIIGIEFLSSNFSAAAIGLNGEIVFESNGTTNHKTEGVSNEEYFEKELDIVIRNLLEQLSKNHIVIGICVSVSGIVDVDKNQIIKSDAFGLANYDFNKIFYNRYGIPCIVENDARCCAWLQFSKVRGDETEKQDFICLLAQNSFDNIDIEQGIPSIGVGLSVALNGRLLYGQNYNVGEFLSKSWQKDCIGQTGLSKEEFSRLQSDDEVYKKWLKDIFSTLALFIPLLGPSTIFFHGQNGKRKALIKEVSESQDINFSTILNKFGTKFIIVPKESSEIAHGAAFMYLHQMFTVMETGKHCGIKYFDWDNAFMIHNSALKSNQ